MRRVFLNPELNSRFLEKGYVVIDLLDQEQCTDPLLAYERLHGKQTPDSFFTTTNSVDASYRKECNDYISSFLQPHLAGVFDDYSPLFGNFMIKPPHNNSACNLHQDWTFVDESAFRTVNVWLALQDTDTVNGCIHLIPGSQMLPFPVRGRNITRVYEKAIPSMVENLLEAVPLKKGQCIIFDSAVLHYSPNNLSESTRIGISLMLYPADAQLVHYVYQKQHPDLITRYEVSPEFFVNFAAEEDYGSDNGAQISVKLNEESYDSIRSKLAVLI